MCDGCGDHVLSRPPDLASVVSATRLGQAGCSENLIRAITGHTTIAVPRRYVRPDGTMAEAAIAKLEDARRKPKP